MIYGVIVKRLLLNAEWHTARTLRPSHALGTVSASRVSMTSRLETQMEDWLPKTRLRTKADKSMQTGVIFTFDSFHIKRD